jgi:hypothetical protein
LERSNGAARRGFDGGANIGVKLGPEANPVRAFSPPSWRRFLIPAVASARDRGQAFMTSTAPARRLVPIISVPPGSYFPYPRFVSCLIEGPPRRRSTASIPRGEGGECRRSEVEARAEGISLSRPGNQLMAVKAMLDIRSSPSFSVPRARLPGSRSRRPCSS